MNSSVKGRMLRNTLIAMLVAAFAVSACSSAPAPVTRWSKPGGTQEGFVADRAACVKVARLDANGFYVGGVGYPGQAGGIGRFFGNIESELHVSDPELNRGVSQDVFARCMNRQGYHVDPKGFAPPEGDEVPMEF